jgi:hypothetical protein
MTFEEWLNRPLYRVHVTTARELSRLVGLDPFAAHATIGDSPLLHFRVLPAHRTARSLAIRKLVADRMRALRREHGRDAIVKYVGA